MEILFGFFFFVHREELKRKKQTKIPSVSERIIFSAILENPFFWFRVHYFLGNNFFHLQFHPVLDRKNTISKRNLEIVPKDGTISGWNFHHATPEQDRVNEVDKIARAKL